MVNEMFEASYIVVDLNSRWLWPSYPPKRIRPTDSCAKQNQTHPRSISQLQFARNHAEMLQTQIDGNGGASTPDIFDDIVCSVREFGNTRIYCCDNMAKTPATNKTHAQTTTTECMIRKDK